VDKASWIEVSIQATPEQAEAIAEIFGQFTQEGVVIEQLVEDESNSEHLILQNVVNVYGYIFADENAEDKKTRLEEGLWHLSQIQALQPPKYRQIQDQDWMAAWKKHYRPLKIGDKLAILPAWADNPFPHRIPIRINPGMAFGTGTHPTTQLCMEILEEIIAPGQYVMDIGCGSGVLSAAAVKLGAEHAFAVDISPAAVASSDETFQINGISEKAEVQQGSIAEIISGCFDTTHAHVVTANILASVIVRLLDEGLAGLILPGGYLIMSGILTHQVDEVIDKTRSHGLELVKQKNIGDWAALCLRG